MTKIIVTGATGNIGMPTLKYLRRLAPQANIVGCGSNISNAAGKLSGIPDIKIRKFDFEDATTVPTAIEGGDVLFLLRPPQIADAEKFRPLLEAAKNNKFKGVVFLSVQGADKQSYIPHAKIEKLIIEIGLPYVFLRPGYFMQNLTSTLLTDVQSGTIILPAANAPFMWVDADNVGEVAANVLLRFDEFKNSAIEITGSELLSFTDAVREINTSLGTTLKYKSVNLLKFWRHRKKQGTSAAMIAVMIMLHYLPRRQKPPHISTAYQDITGKKPTLLAEFAIREKEILCRKSETI